MKLGTQTGSMINHIYSRMVVGQPDAKVGMGATVLCWTDRHAATIIEIDNAHQFPVVRVRLDHAKRVDTLGMTDSGQQYEYSPHPQGTLYRFRFRNRRWEEVEINGKTGRWRRVEGGGHGLRIGEREEYHDFSF